MDLFLLFLKIGASIQKKRYQPCVEVATKLLMKRILFTIVGYFTCYIWNIVGPENDRVCLENNAPRTLVINEFSNSFFSLQFSFYIQSDSALSVIVLPVVGEGRGVDLLEPVGRGHRRRGGGLGGQGVVAVMVRGHRRHGGDSRALAWTGDRHDVNQGQG